MCIVLISEHPNAFISQITRSVWHTNATVRSGNKKMTGVKPLVNVKKKKQNLITAKSGS